MVEFTEIPARPLAEFARLLQKERYSENCSISVTQMLQILRCRFQQEEEIISTTLLHYQDGVLQSNAPKPTVQFALHDESQKADDEERKPLRRVYPVTPQRPDPSTLAKLMEVSYTEWSDSSYEDTTGDSKLAQWLASFANKDLNLSRPDPALGGASPTQTIKKNFIDNGCEQTPLSDSPYSSSPQSFLLPAFTSPALSPYSRRHHPNASIHNDVSPRRRALSDPPTPSKRMQYQVHTRSCSTSHNELSPRKEQVNHDADEMKDGRRMLTFSFMKSPALSPFRLRNRQASETTNFSPSTASLPVTPSTPNHNQSPVHFLRPNLFTTPLRHTIDSHQSRDETAPDQSNATSLADISGVHAFNLSLQHSTKSPFLIRTWKRMLGELAGRFPLSLGDNGSTVDEVEGVDTRLLDIVEPSVVTHEVNSSLDQSIELGSSSLEKSALAGITASTPGMPSFQTHADILLDREYAAYLRGNIATKQREIRYLQELIAQREKTIERMEFALKRRALEVLRSHEAQN